jgi:hypothetical protein
MVPIPDDPVATGRSNDPVRLMVHAALALYLSPVILVVCLIGGTSVLAGGAAKIARKFVDRPGRDPVRPGRAGAPRNGPRPIGRRERSHSAR